MKNYICINEVKTELTDKQVGKVKKLLGMKDRRLSEVPVGQTVRIGDHVMIVLEQSGDTTAVICKDEIKTCAFGSNNNYNGSGVEQICSEFAKKVAEKIGSENVVLHDVDLTADDGLKDYGNMDARASLLTKDLYKKYVSILDEYPVDCWWWLATATATKTHGNTSWVECVSPSGVVIDSRCNLVSRGVRPFCILESDIFVS